MSDKIDFDHSFGKIWFSMHMHFFGLGLPGEEGTPHEEAFDYYNRILGWCDVMKMSKFEIILVLRSLSSQRDKLSNYNGLLLAAKKELDARGEDGAGILKGLF